MNPQRATRLIQFVGTLAGIFGVIYVGSAFLVAFPANVPGLNPVWVHVFRGFTLLLGLYLLWVCYLVWFQFTPKAVRQVCGLAAFSLVAAISSAMGTQWFANSFWMPFAFLGIQAAIYYGYRRSTRYLNEILFPDQH